MPDLVGEGFLGIRQRGTDDFWPSLAPALMCTQTCTHAHTYNLFFFFLFSFNCQFDTAQSHLRRESQLQDYPDKIGTFGGGRRPSPLWVALYYRQATLGCMKKLAKHGPMRAPKSKPASGTPSWFILYVSSLGSAPTALKDGLQPLSWNTPIPQPKLLGGGGS